MSKKGYLYIASVVFALGLIAFGSRYTGYVNFQYGRPYRILLVSSSAIPTHQDIRKFFLNAVAQNRGCRSDVQDIFVADPGDAIKTTAICESALSLPTDCIVVVGTAISRSLISLAIKRKSMKPIVFIGVAAPVELGLVESVHRPGGMVTGATSLVSDLCQYPGLLHSAFPQIKSVLLPMYMLSDNVDDVARRMQGIKKGLEGRGIFVAIVEIDALTDIIKRVEGVLNGHDMLVTVETDACNDVYAPALAHLAERHGIGYFAGAAAALNENALCVYATSFRYVAEAAFEQVRQILYEHKHPSTMPVIFLSSTREFIINKKRAAEIGLPVDLDEINAKINADPTLESVRGRVRVV